MDWVEGFKIIALVSILLVGIIGGLLPLKLSKYDPSGRGISLANMFAGGVFFGAGLLHLLPEASAGIKDYYYHQGIMMRFPLAYLLSAGGFFLILSTEEFVLWIQERREKKQAERKKAMLKSVGSPDSFNWGRFDDGEVGGSLVSSLIPRSRVHLEPTQSGRKKATVGDSGLDGIDLTVYQKNPVKHPSGTAALIDNEHREGAGGGHSHGGDGHDHGGDGHDDHDHLGSVADPSSKIASFILLCALSTHSIFEGLALGTQDTTSGGLQVFVAIAVHKGLEAFSLGISLVKSDTEYSFIAKLIVMFSMMTPFGIALGIALSAIIQGDSGRMLTAVVESIASGSFLFVAISEVISKELADERDKLPKVILLILGFGVICLLQAFHSADTAHEHCMKIVDTLL